MTEIPINSDFNQQKTFGPNFKLFLYYSAVNEEEALGLTLCEKLSAVTRKLDKKNFNFVLRLGNAVKKQPRWNK